MFALKVIGALLFLVSTLLKFGLDYWWRDRRTTKHRRVRTAFLSIALLAGTVTSVAVLTDYLNASRTAADQRNRLDTILNFTAGGLAPDVLVELYVGPNHPTPPRLNLQPEFPGLVAVWIENNLDHPIYDVEVFMIHERPEGGWSRTCEVFNTPPKHFEVLGANESRSFLLPADLVYRPDWPMVSFDFLTRTKRGATRQRSRFFLISNKWEHARQSVDLTATNVLLTEVSAQYPRDEAGEPVWYSTRK